MQKRKSLRHSLDSPFQYKWYFNIINLRLVLEAQKSQEILQEVVTCAQKDAAFSKGEANLKKANLKKIGLEHEHLVIGLSNVTDHLQNLIDGKTEQGLDSIFVCRGDFPAIPMMFAHLPTMAQLAQMELKTKEGGSSETSTIPLVPLAAGSHEQLTDTFGISQCLAFAIKSGKSNYEMVSFLMDGLLPQIPFVPWLQSAETKLEKTRHNSIIIGNHLKQKRQKSTDTK
jgi:hypothetical protein